MKGVPTDLPLEDLKGAELIQIALGEFQVQFHFNSTANISVEGRWELRDGKGNVIDTGARGSLAAKQNSHLQVLLGKKVEGHSISAPKSFTLRFNSGHTLEIFDDSDQYESFSYAGYYV